MVPDPTRATLTHRLLAEALGTMLLLAVVIGSGIMAERLTGGNIASAWCCTACSAG